MTNISKKGFTLVETLVAIAILMIAMTGPFMSLEQSILAARAAQDKMTATYLAQEGVEFVRAVRDEVYLKECYGQASCNANWWQDFFNEFSHSGVFNMHQCSYLGFGCSFNPYPGTPTYNSAAGPISDPGPTELNVCHSNSCGQLYVNNTTGAYSTDSSGGVKTPFSRTVSATYVSPTEVNVVSKVTWDEHGSAESVSATDHLTAWE